MSDQNVTEAKQIFGKKHKATCKDTSCNGCHPSYLRLVRRYFFDMNWKHLPSCLNSYLNSGDYVPTCKGCSEDYVLDIEYRKAKKLALVNGTVKEVFTKVYINGVEDAGVVVEMPSYPMHVWEGTAYKDYADLAAVGNNIPKEFFVETLKTVTGAIVGNSLKCSKYEINPRFFTVLIVPGQGGKGTSIDWAQKFYKDFSAMNGVYLGSLLWGLDDPQGSMGTAVCGFASDAGMMKAAKSQTRWLQVYEELNTFMEKAGIQGSGQSLLAANRSLFDNEEFHMSATEKRAGGTIKVCNSLLAGTTPDLWKSMFKGTQSVGSGLFQRFSITAHDGNFERVGTLPKPICGSLQRFMVDKIADLETSPIDFFVSPEANYEMNSWYGKLQAATRDKDEVGRINVIAMKNALHLAWLKGHQAIEVEDMKGGIAVAEYHLQTRKMFKPNVGENTQAQLQETFLQILKTKPMSKSEVFDKAHAFRLGTDVANRAWEGLGDSRLITQEGRKFRPATPEERENGHLHPKK
jgi:hypothetical protein